MSTQACFIFHVAAAKKHEAKGETSLAFREWKEAVRLRPRDKASKVQMQRLANVLEKVEMKRTDRGIGLRPLVSHFNLCVRYWDSNQPTLAMEEARQAQKILERLGLPLGCVEHNLRAIEQSSDLFRQEEMEILAELKANGRSAALLPNYELGVLYFDKKMLLAAENQLTKTKNLLKSRMQCKLAGNPSLSFASPELTKLGADLNGIEDDLVYIEEQKETFCIEGESGKTKLYQGTRVRDTARPQLLPCILCRMTDSCVEKCSEWWKLLNDNPRVRWDF